MKDDVHQNNSFNGRKEMKKTKLFFMLSVCVFMLVACKDNQLSQTNETVEQKHEHLDGSFITVKMLNNELEIEGDYCSAQKEYLSFFVNDINKNICLQEGESFTMEILVDECTARYCTDGHDFNSATAKYIGQHTVKVEQDYWTCYMYAYTYTCSKCGYQTIVITHSINHS